MFTAHTKTNRLRKQPIWHKDRRYSSYVSRDLTRYGKEGRSGKNLLGSVRWPIPENPLLMLKSCRDLLHRSSYNQFCPKCRCHCNRGRQGRNL